MEADRLSGAPPYAIAGVTWREWITNHTDNPGTARYEWRAGAANRLRVGKSAGQFWVSVDGRQVVGNWVLPSQAMWAAVRIGERRAA